VSKKSLSDKPGLNDNLIIHGDNLKALKSLLPMYAGKVKCVYIDPPYNTGNEGWAYNDNVTSPMMKEWLGVVVEREDLTRHDKWLCMMMPRLFLLRELLHEEGAIFISIDYNEEAQLRLLMDEIFGEENYRNTFAVARIKKNIQEKEKVKALNFGFNSLLFYAKSERCLIIPPRKEQHKEERWHAFDAPGKRPTMEYKIFGVIPPKGRHWMYEEDRAKEMILKNQIKKTVAGSIHYLLAASDYTLVDTDWTDLQESASNWDFPNGEKNPSLIKRIVRMMGDTTGIVLDSFAGSGTTGHAVLELNQEDKSDIKFLLVEQEEYAPKIAQRLRAVSENVGGSFTYCELGSPFDVDGLLAGRDLPSYEDLAQYIFYTATGKDFDPKAIKAKDHLIGSSDKQDVYLWYVPNVQKLKDMAFTLDDAEAMGKPKAGRRRLVFAPMKYVDQQDLDRLAIDFAHLPYEIYERIP
jgi:adenine-specific DNA-methyltransferase